MIRMVRNPEGCAVFDIDARLPGRGAYVCPLASCLCRLSPSSLSYHLRAPVALPDQADLLSSLVLAWETKVRNLLTIGLKAGQVRIGARAAEEALDTGRAALLLLASDTAKRTELHLLRRARNVPLRRMGAKKRLGGWLGRSTAGSVVVLDGGLATRLVSFLDRLTSIEDSSYHAGQQ